MLFSRMSAGRGQILAAALTVCLCLGSMPGEAIAEAARHNVVLILTDDEDVGAHAFMPKTKALIEDQGATFANYFISYPWCCPSRASILRGQYAHNTNIVGNEPPWGGYETFHGLGLEQSTLATWLQAAGYRTAMIGKYLNRYMPEKDGVPPGWDEWHVGGNAHASYDYVLNENGQTVHYGNEPEDYLNDVLTGKATEVIRTSAAADEPFFLYVLPYNPHSPSVAAPRHEGMFANAELPRPPSFDEADVSDKPAFIRGLPPLDQDQIAYLEYEYRRRIASLQAVDDMVESIVGTLADTGQLDDTYVIYSSDNGFHMGAAPADRRQGYALRRGHPGADGDARPGRARRFADRGRGGQHRSRADHRPDRGRRDPRFRRWPLVPAALPGPRPALAGGVPDRAAQARGAARAAVEVQRTDARGARADGDLQRHPHARHALCRVWQRRARAVRSAWPIRSSSTA